MEFHCGNIHGCYTRRLDSRIKQLRTHLYLFYEVTDVHEQLTT